jgi:putative SOS response-associated peptidase YedK
MCGRFNLRTSASQLKEFFELFREPAVTTRYNIAPTQTTVVCRRNDAGQRELVPLRWGLIPSWSKDIKIGVSLINARSESVAEKPSFRTAFRKRRCLVPASGFYEWLREGKNKQPYHIHRVDDGPFAMAGLAECWNRGDQPIESFSIVTTSANQLMRSIHDRMPVILDQKWFDAWLDPKGELEFLKALIQPQEWTGFEALPVSPVVNNARNETPECVQPA